MPHSRLPPGDSWITPGVSLPWLATSSELLSEDRAKAIKDILSEIDYLEIELLKQENQVLRVRQFEEMREKNEEGLKQIKESVEKEVEALRGELEEAKHTKQKKQEYENVAARILKYPAVAESVK